MTAIRSRDAVAFLTERDPVAWVREEATKQDLICGLDACVAHLYGLDESDLAVIYETFHEGKDYSARHAAVLEHFRRWENRR